MSGEPLRVYAMPADRGGLGWHRVRFPSLAVDQLVEGISVTLGDDEPDAALEDHDVVVFQNAVYAQQLELVRELHARGIAVVVDVDDDVDNTPAGNAAHEVLIAGGGAKMLGRICREADMVTVSTPPLLRYAGDGPASLANHAATVNGRGRVLRNCVPGIWTTLPRADRGELARSVIWSGGVAWHTGDLEATAGGVGAALAARPEVGVRVVGYGEGVRQALSLANRTELVATGWVDMGLDEGYPLELAYGTVGIAPTTSTPFARAKSALKGLELAALGVPFIASATHPEYVRLAGFGIGQLAHGFAGWRARVGHLLDHDAEREQLGAAARVLVGAFTYERNAWRWADVWREAATRRQAVSSAAPMRRRARPRARRQGQSSEVGARREDRE